VDEALNADSALPDLVRDRGPVGNPAEDRRPRALIPEEVRRLEIFRPQES
jgi:hypothetical protein